MSWRLNIIIIIIAGILTIPYGYICSGEGKIVELDSLIDEALRNNLGLQAAYDNWKASEYKIKQVRSLSDPVASFSFFGENVETKVGPQERKYGLSQMIPFPGKLGLKGKIAGKDAKVMKEKYEKAKREIINKVKASYYDIWWVDKAIEVTETEKDIVNNLEQVAKQKFEIDQAPQQDAIKAQVLISMLLDKLLRLKQQRKSLVAKMNSLLNRPTDAPMGRLQEFETVDFNYSLEELYRFSKESRQELIIANLDIQKKELQKSLAKLSYFPNFMLGFTYIQVGDSYTTMPEDGKDAWMGMISVNIPIWFGKLNAQFKEKQINLEAGKKNYQDKENNINSEVEDTYFKIETYKEQISLYKTVLIPQTNQAFQAAKSAYETSKVDFLNWLDSERVLLQTRLAYYKVISDYQKSIASMEKIVGRNL